MIEHGESVHDAISSHTSISGNCAYQSSDFVVTDGTVSSVHTGNSHTLIHR